MLLKLPISETKQYVISLGDGSKRTSQGKCKGLIIKEEYLMVRCIYIGVGRNWCDFGSEMAGNIRGGQIKLEEISYELWGRGKTIILEGAQVDDNNPSMALQEILGDEKGKRIDIPFMELEVQQEKELQEFYRSI